MRRSERKKEVTKMMIKVQIEQRKKTMTGYVTPTNTRSGKHELRRPEFNICLSAPFRSPPKSAHSYYKNPTAT